MTIVDFLIAALFLFGFFWIIFKPWRWITVKADDKGFIYTKRLTKKEGFISYDSCEVIYEGGFGIGYKSLKLAFKMDPLTIGTLMNFVFGPRKFFVIKHTNDSLDLFFYLKPNEEVDNILEKLRPN